MRAVFVIISALLMGCCCGQLENAIFNGSETQILCGNDKICVPIYSCRDREMDVYGDRLTIPSIELDICGPFSQCCHIANQSSFHDEHSNQKFGLELPYIRLLPYKSFSVGKSIRIEGRVKLQGRYFFVNLQRGQKLSPYPTMTFHFNPRFEEEGGGRIHLNAWYNGDWASERSRELDADFFPGKNFSLVIVCGLESYHVYVNKRLITEFQFQIDPEIADTVYMEGDLELWDVVLENYSPTFGGQKSSFQGDGGLELPHYGLLPPKSFSIGKSIRIEGRVKLDPSYFVVNLLRGHNIWPHSVIAFHFNPRYTNQSNGTIFLNAWFSGNWAIEQTKELDADFFAGKNFSLVIVCGLESYHVYANKRLITEFKYKIDPEIADTVYVQGDLELWDVVFENHASTLGVQKLSFSNQKTKLELPYRGLLPPNSFAVGRSIRIEGRVKLDPSYFVVNLQKGKKVSPQRIIAFHLNPRYTYPDVYTIVESAFYNGQWADEQRSEFPEEFFPGKNFSLVILFTLDSYDVYVNKKLITKFKFKVDPEIVETVEVNGDIQLWDVVFENDEPTIGEQNSGLELPYYGLLPQKGFSVGKIIRIEGRVKLDPSYFVVNLLRGHNIWPYPTVAFHFNPRYTNESRGTIHLNAWYSGTWATEQRRRLPADFLPGKNFSLVIACGMTSYNVYVNRRLITEFRFQVQPEIADTVYVQGDIQLWHVVLGNNAPAIGEQKLSYDDFVDTVPVYSNNDLGVIEEGLSFRIIGHILPNCERFSINLILGTPTRDIALHFSLHMSQNDITCNSRVKNVWGNEEVFSELPFSLLRGSNFGIQILVTDNCFVISVNGHHLTDFNHRLPYTSIVSIEVTGDVDNIGFNRIEASKPSERLLESKIIFNGTFNFAEENTLVHRKITSPYHFQARFPKWSLIIRN